MKKLISLVLVALLILSLSVSALAVGNEVYLRDGVVLPDFRHLMDDEFPNVYVFYCAEWADTGGYVLFRSSGKFTRKLTSSIHSSTMTSYDVEIYGLTNGSWELIESSSLAEIEDDLYTDLLWCNHSITYSDGSFFFETYDIGNSDTAYCDGSSCPANDLNHDGICDDCGARLMNLVRQPVAPDVSGNNKNFVMFYNGETYYYTAYTSDTAYSIRGYNYGARMRSTTDISVYVQRFDSYDGINWEAEYTGNAKDYYPGEQGWTLLSSSFNWYDSSENTTDPFFPVPLWAEVEKVTQGEIPGMTAKLTEVLTILTVLGVGCLALLILLKLFGRRSLIYRG